MMQRISLRSLVARAVGHVDAQQPISLAQRQARRDAAGAALAVVSVSFAVLVTAAQMRAEPAGRAADAPVVVATAGTAP